jgi:transcriptional regulator with XRE-family HTH domain
MRLRDYRKHALLTQEQLADRSGVSVRTIRALECGRVDRPLPATVRLLADALGLGDAERRALTPLHQAGAAVPAGSVPAELPADVAWFAGRTGSLTLLDGLLGSPGQVQATPVAVIAIAGAAGVGKSALAIHAAHRAAGRFPDGQLYVNLHGATPGVPPLDPLEALGRLLRSLSLDSAQVPASPDEAAARFRSLGPPPAARQPHLPRPADQSPGAGHAGGRPNTALGRPAA